MNRFKSLLGKSPIPIIPKTAVTPAIDAQTEQTVNPKKYDRYIKEGPQYLVTKILMVHGPLQNKQIWRIYTRMLKENTKLQKPQKIEVFRSLSHLKNVIKFMIEKQKIKTAGYEKKLREHKGWQIQTDKALKFIHPQAIQSIQKAISAKDII